MLALFDGIFEMHRAEYRRRTQQHDIHARVDHFLVGVETEEAIFVGYLLSLIFQRLPARVQLSGNTSPRAVICKPGPGIQKLQAAPVPRPPQPTSPAFSGRPSGALASISGTVTVTFFFGDEQPVSKAGTPTVLKTPKVPNAELLIKSLRLNLKSSFMGQ